MALADRWLLPEGVKEILPPQAQHIENMRRRLLDLYHTWGYDLVLPPLMEYLDSLLTGTGNDLALNTFKLTDQLTGHLMGIRADTTPQVARIDAHCLRQEHPTRLCYVNSVLHTHPAHRLASRSPLQVGAELFGHAGIDSDLEVICLMLETLRETRVDQHLTLDLGHVGIYRSLMKAAALSETQETALFEMLQRKALTELREFVASLGLEAGMAGLLGALPELHGGREVLDQALALSDKAPQGLVEAIEELSAVVDKVLQRYPGLDIYVDLGELRGSDYHTGLVFAAYVPSYGQAIAKGGRYDDIGRVFGRARPAAGFSADLKVLAELSSEGQAREAGIYAPSEADAGLDKAVADLRAKGERVVQALSGQTGDAGVMGCDRRLVFERGEWTVTPI